MRCACILCLLSGAFLPAQTGNRPQLCLDGFCIGQSIRDRHFGEVSWIVPKDAVKKPCASVGCRPEVAFRGYTGENQKQLGEALSWVYGLRVYNVITKEDLAVLRQYRYECNLSPRGSGGERRFIGAYLSSAGGYLTVIGLRLIGGELRVYRIARQYPYHNRNELTALGRKLQNEYGNEIFFSDALSSNAYPYVIQQVKNGWFGRSTMFNPTDFSDNEAELVLVDPATRPLLAPASMPDSGEIRQLPVNMPEQCSRSLPIQ
jgi:hypothetical protein